MNLNHIQNVNFGCIVFIISLIRGWCGGENNCGTAVFVVEDLYGLL